MTVLVIYLIGFLLSFVLSTIYMYKEFNEINTSIISVCLSVSIMSYISALIILYLFVKDLIVKIRVDNYEN